MTSLLNKPFCLTDDYLFKNIFIDPERLRSFLANILIDVKILPADTKILEIDYLPTEFIQKLPKEISKKVYFDLHVTTNNGKFIVEMQKEGSDDYLKRGEFYSSLAHCNQPIKNSGNKKMQEYQAALPVFLLSLIGDKIFDKDVPCLSYHTTTERETGKHFIGAISFIFIELGKFENPMYKQADCSTATEEWLHFFKKNAITEDYKTTEVNNASEFVYYIIENKYEEYFRSHLSEKAVEGDLKEAKIKAEAKGGKEGLEEGLQKGLEEGLQKGLEEGLQKGLEEGLQKGLEELRKKELETAKSLLKNGVDISIIKMSTSVTDEDLKNLF